MTALNIYKNRTNTIPVNLGFDVSDDTIVSQIRAGKDISSDLIASWDVSFETDGTDGHLIFEIDDSDLDEITAKRGWMDIKRIVDGEPLPVLKRPIKVIFRDVVTQ